MARNQPDPLGFGEQNPDRLKQMVLASGAELAARTEQLHDAEVRNAHLQESLRAAEDERDRLRTQIAQSDNMVRQVADTMSVFTQEVSRLWTVMYPMVEAMAQLRG
jgi:septal ring factor EnvC (AmiA/AmiB activator)